MYDNTARELKTMADQGLIRIIREQLRGGAERSLLGRINFTRLR